MKVYLLLLLGFGLISCQKNEIKVEVVGIEDKVKIKLNNMGLEKVIYETSRQVNKIPERHGENDWSLAYADSLCARFRHIKFNLNDKHSYFFNFFKSGKDIYCRVTIKGDSPINDTLKLADCRLLKLQSK